jgi:hypothetical protein
LVFGSHVTPVPKGYLYFAIFLSLVEVLKTWKPTRKRNKIIKKSSLRGFFI